MSARGWKANERRLFLEHAEGQHKEPNRIECPSCRAMRVQAEGPDAIEALRDAVENCSWPADGSQDRARAILARVDGGK